MTKDAEKSSPDLKPQPNNPLHGITLEMILSRLVAHYGWREMAKMIPVRCFMNNPSIKSSLQFLRKTPWARKKVEELYLRNLDVLAKIPESTQSYLAGGSSFIK